MPSKTNLEKHRRFGQEMPQRFQRIPVAKSPYAITGHDPRDCLFRPYHVVVQLDNVRVELRRLIFKLVIAFDESKIEEEKGMTPKLDSQREQAGIGEDLQAFEHGFEPAAATKAKMEKGDEK